MRTGGAWDTPWGCVRSVGAFFFPPLFFSLRAVLDMYVPCTTLNATPTQTSHTPSVDAGRRTPPRTHAPYDKTRLPPVVFISRERTRNLLGALKSYVRTSSQMRDGPATRRNHRWRVFVMVQLRCVSFTSHLFTSSHHPSVHPCMSLTCVSPRQNTSPRTPLFAFRLFIIPCFPFSFSSHLYFLHSRTVSLPVSDACCSHTLTLFVHLYSPAQAPACQSLPLVVTVPA